MISTADSRLSTLDSRLLFFLLGNENETALRRLPLAIDIVRGCLFTTDREHTPCSTVCVRKTGVGFGVILATRITILQARPALEKIVTHWETVPRQDRHALLEGLSHYVNITRLSRASKRVTIYRRDGSASTHQVIRESRGYFWEKDEVEKLREMIESNVDQVEILRAFPDYTWRALQERYSYRFGKRQWQQLYRGKRTYTKNTKWSDTAEYQAERAQAQLTTNGTYTDRYK